jgi:hypothetical protein
MTMMDKSVDTNLGGLNPTFYFRKVVSLKYEIRALLLFAKSFLHQPTIPIIPHFQHHGSQVKSRNILLVTDDENKWKQYLRKHL